MTTITIVTPWLDHPELADGYFDAVKVTLYGDEVFVVDNGSSPPLDFATVRLERNEGVHFANNIGLKKARTDAVLFLNNDVELIDVNWLGRIRFALAPGVLVGARLRLDRHTAVDGIAEPYLDGWCVAGMREDLLAIGGWDETLDEPAYYGDNLLSLAAREAGIKLLAIDVGLRHIESVTSRSLDWSSVHAAAASNRRVYQRAVRDARELEATLKQTKEEVRT